MAVPLLEASRVRVDVDGAVELDGLSFQSTGERLLVLGAAPALFAACSGRRTPRHGELRVAGAVPVDAVKRGELASVRLGAPMPGTWTVATYLVWSARLAGHGASDAASHARGALARMKLEALEGVHLRHVPLEAARAVAVAAALATGATTLLLEDPTQGLPQDAARRLGRALVLATQGRRTVVFASRASLASPVALDADEALVFDNGRLVVQGPPAEVASRERAYRVCLHGSTERFASLAEARGVSVVGEGARWTVDLGPTLQVSDLLDLASAAGAVVVDLRPLAYAFG